MFCPRCSQKQSSEKVKFCSRCGFELGLVSEILNHDGNLPQLTGLVKTREKLEKRMTILFGLSVWLVVVFFFNIISLIGSNTGWIVRAGFGFLLGLFIMILTAPSVIELIKKSQMSGKKLAEKEVLLKNFRTNNSLDALQLTESSPQSYIAPNSGLKVDTTNELFQPPSVVEETTKFLKKDQ